ncbi:ESX-1 secretion-associated protein EspI [Mycobacteroides abscessus subsp. abscessus]|nr:ESX-1 secretion-associated protein EspI [Mycobacteroides abscessus subsp. abscessus]SKD12433.1 ESX-1 secretion-associated protein EspI [Mycobacteroides abscessus subsp. abscessus]SKL18745.1 ESX-1 secretion-associated protein EspI [Mycobacteroides abscessus subsp. abscessus]SKM86420.1 ESX-1 secretion-associated protein EspI [Mycobacteroides abscessus subsp. abscessus]
MSDYPAHRAPDGPSPYAADEAQGGPTAPPWAAQEPAQPVMYGQSTPQQPHEMTQQFQAVPFQNPFAPQQDIAGLGHDPAVPSLNSLGGSFAPLDFTPSGSQEAGDPTAVGAAGSSGGPGGFRADNRFSDSGEQPAQPTPFTADRWASDTPPSGIPQQAQQPPVGGSRYYTPVGGQQTGVGGQIRPELPPSSRDLSTSALLRPHKPAPSAGWRKTVYRASFGTINLGEGTKKTEENDLIAQVNQPLQGCYKIALLSLKGGVGKTTVTATLGATFASIRGDRVIAVDANPDRGTLSQKVPLETPATVRHLLRDANSIQRYSDVRSYTSQGPSRLEVLASESDPAVSEAFSAEDYSRTLEILEKFYSVVLTDCGTGLMHSAMSSVLEQADTLVVISSGSVDGARSASATLDWLDAHGHRELVRRSIAVINAVRPRSGKVDMQKVVDHFSRRCRAVRLVPFDPHLEEGAEISLDRLRPQTRRALIELAAVVAQGFTGTQRQQQTFQG